MNICTVFMNLLNKCRLEKSYLESVVSLEDMRFQLWVVEYPLPDKVWISHERFSNKKKKKSFNSFLKTISSQSDKLSTSVYLLRVTCVRESTPAPVG